MNPVERRVSDHMELGWDSKKVTYDFNVKWNIKEKSEGVLDSITLTGNGKLTTPIQGWESIAISHASKMVQLTEKPSYTGHTTYVNSEGKSIEVTDKMDYPDPP